MKLTQEQKNMLLQFIEENDDIAKGKLHPAFTAKDAARLWQEVTVQLNACAGAKKTWKEWRKSWQDLKSSTKMKAAAVSREGNRTGGGPPSDQTAEGLTDFQKRIIQVVGKSATYGHEDVVESEIDLNNTQEDITTPLIIEFDNGTVGQLEMVDEGMARVFSTELLSEARVVDLTTCQETSNASQSPAVQQNEETKSNLHARRKSTPKRLRRCETTLHNAAEARRDYAETLKKKILLKERELQLKEKEFEARQQFQQQILAAKERKIAVLKEIAAAINKK